MNSTEWYEQNAAIVIPRYESLRAEVVHHGLLELIPNRPSLVLDIGAGSGRDAAWFAAQGHEVIAVEPAVALREAAQQLHPDPRIRWIEDRLPSLQQLHRLGMAFDFILLSAVWMHLPPTERSKAGLEFSATRSASLAKLALSRSTLADLEAIPAKASPIGIASLWKRERWQHCNVSYSQYFGQI